VSRRYLVPDHVVGVAHLPSDAINAPPEAAAATVAGARKGSEEGARKKVGGSRVSVSASGEESMEMRAMHSRRGGGSSAEADAEAEALLRGLDEMESQARLGKDSLGFTVELLTAQEEFETKVRPVSPSDGPTEISPAPRGEASRTEALDTQRSQEQQHACMHSSAMNNNKLFVAADRHARSAKAGE
jgi:hypothetical protein